MIEWRSHTAVVTHEARIEIGESRKVLKLFVALWSRPVGPQKWMVQGRT